MTSLPFDAKFAVRADAKELVRLLAHEFRTRIELKQVGRPLMLVLNPWRLELLFLVSGVATRVSSRITAGFPITRTNMRATLK